ncbi:MAG: leuE [Rhodocyclales bacterium]|nr:leuE [Rhodocyclales bacterium]
MFYGITDIATYILGCIFIVLLPGPNSLFVMTLASREGIARGYAGVFGIFVGDTILMLLSASGVASLLHTAPVVFMLMKYAGAAYLGWIGIGLLRAAWVRWRSMVNEVPSPGIDTSQPFRKALLISLMNPKAILFFVSFFIQFVDPHYARPAVSFLILGVIVQIFSAIYLSTLIFGGVRLARQFQTHPRFSALATGAVGSVFIAFAVKLASASL